jgi:predicted nucleic acid-binding protein
VAVLIDTDLLVDVERGVRSPAFEEILGEQERAISVITVSELLHGVHRATGAFES